MDFPLIQFKHKKLQGNVQIVEMNQKLGDSLIFDFEEALQILYKLLVGSYEDLGAELGKFTEGYEIDIDSVRDAIQRTIDYWVNLCNKLHKEGKYKFQILSVTVGQIFCIVNEIKLELTIETTEGYIKTLLKLE